ncbi:MAG TPA: TonB-dependent receptor [Nitrospirota bacterium]|nr:TonB-dependent receptor [Nitrospirota bacterium]
MLMLLRLIIFCLSMVFMLDKLQGSPAQAEESAASDGNLEDAMLFQDVPLVYGASKYEQKVTEAPSSVSVITASDIRTYGYRTLADILKSIRSFYVTYDRNYSYVGVRGFGPPGDYNSGILLLVDGHRVNNNIYDSAYIGTEAIIDVDLIDHVEVIRGPGSSLYGSNAFFAVVNVITKRGRDWKGYEVSGEAGSYDTYKGRLSYGQRFTSGLETVISASGYDSKGQRLYFGQYDPANPNHDTRAANGGYADNADYDRSRTIFFKSTYSDFTAAGAYVSRTKGIPTGSFGTDFNNRSSKTEDEHIFADLKYDHAITPKTDLSLRLFYDYYHYDGIYAYYQDPTLNTMQSDWSYGTWWGGEARLTSNMNGHRVIVGAEYQGNLRQDQGDDYAGLPSDSWRDLRRSENWAFYVQDEVRLSKKMLFNAGLRYDHYTTFGDTTNPRLALIYNPTDEVAVKLLYGTAFQTPNVYDLYYSFMGIQLPNPGLKPENITTYELVYEQFLGKEFTVSVSGYHYRITDLIAQINVGTASTMYKNVSAVSATGVEFELHKKWANSTDVRASYSTQRAEDEMTGEPLTNSPEHLAKLNISAPLLGQKTYVGAEEQYTSRSKAQDGGFLGGYFITNVTLFSQKYMRSFDVSASIYNLFDKSYSYPVSANLLPLNAVRQDGRTYRFKITYAF